MLTMSELIQEYLTALRTEGDLAETTINDRARVLLRLHDDLPYGIAAGCREQIQAWLGHTAWSRWTRRTYANHIIAFGVWLGLHGCDDPARGLRRPRAPRPTAKQVPREAEILLFAGEPVRTAAHLARYQGLRRAETVGCHRNHITEDTTLIVDAKGGDPQTIPTHPAVWELIRDRPAGPLLVDEHGPLTLMRLSRMVRRHYRQAGLPGLGLHDLRRLYGLEVYRLTAGDIRVTQEALRHATVATTMLYTAVADQRRVDAVRGLPRVTAIEAGSSRLDLDAG
jgi:integrase